MKNSPKTQTQHRRTSLNLSVFFASAAMASVLALVSGCSGKTSSNGGTTGTVDDPIVIHGRICGPDECTYFMGAYDGFPDQVDLGKTVELGPDAFNISAYDGAVFTWDGESVTWTRWTVNEDLSFSNEGVMSLAGLGVRESGGSLPAFVAEDEAYLFQVPERLVVRFDPQRMEIVETIDMPAPPVQFGVPQGFVPYVSGSNIVVPINSVDWDRFEYDPQAMAALVLDTATSTLDYIVDERMATGQGAFMDENGDLYYCPSRFAAHMHHYGTQDTTGFPTVQGLLRIKQGENGFDPDFFQRLDEVNGDPAIWNTNYLGDGKILQLTFAQDVASWPSDPNQWWNMERTKRIVDMNDWSSELLDDPATEEWNGAWFPAGEVNGTEYFVLSRVNESGTAASAIARYVPSGVEIALAQQSLSFQNVFDLN